VRVSPTNRICLSPACSGIQRCVALLCRSYALYLPLHTLTHTRARLCNAPSYCRLMRAQPSHPRCGVRTGTSADVPPESSSDVTMADAAGGAAAAAGPSVQNPLHAPLLYNSFERRLKVCVMDNMHAGMFAMCHSLSLCLRRVWTVSLPAWFQWRAPAGISLSKALLSVWTMKYHLRLRCPSPKSARNLSPRSESDELRG